MILNVSDLMKRINTDTMNVEFEENVASIDLCGKCIEIMGPIKIIGTFVTDGKIASFSGKARFRLKTECDRCLSEVQRDIVIELDEKFTNDSYSDDENEYYQMIDNKIDFTPVITQNLLINMPMKFLCKEDCPGLINKCEIKTADDSPFAKLKEMF